MWNVTESQVLEWFTALNIDYVLDNFKKYFSLTIKFKSIYCKDNDHTYAQNYNKWHPNDLNIFSCIGPFFFIRICYSGKNHRFFIIIANINVVLM